jgi:hypothetical protein
MNYKMFSQIYIYCSKIYTFDPGKKEAKKNYNLMRDKSDERGVRWSKYDGDVMKDTSAWKMCNDGKHS